MVRCKFRVDSYETRLDRGEELRTVKLNVVCGDSQENKEFFKWTPCGTISIGVLNRAAWEQFPLGLEVYVDFTDATVPAEKAVK